MNTNHKLLILCVIGLIPFIYSSFFAFPSGDDFSYAYKTWTSNSYWDRQIYEWFHWTGRYSSNLLVLLNPMTFKSLALYQAFPIFLIIFSVSTHYIASKELLVKKSQRILVATSFTLLYLGSIPDISEGLYWYTATVTYFLSVCLLPLLLREFYYLINTDRTPLLAIALIIVISGLNEVVLFFISTLSAALFLKFRSKKTLSILLVQLLCFCVVFFAPGNETRSGSFSDNFDWVNTITWGSIHSIRFSIMLLINPFLWILMLFIRSNTAIRIQRKPIWMWLSIFIGLQFIACSAPIWNTGILGQHRTPNLANYAQMIVLLFFFLQGKILLRNPKPLTSFVNLVRKHQIIFFLSSILCLPNLLLCFHDISSGKSAVFREENLQRLSTLSINTAEKTTLKIPAYSSPPRSVFVYDISCDSTHWTNLVYTKYFGLFNRDVHIQPENCLNKEQDN